MTNSFSKRLFDADLMLMLHSDGELDDEFFTLQTCFTFGLGD